MRILDFRTCLWWYLQPTTLVQLHSRFHHKNCLLAGSPRLPDRVLLSHKQKGAPYLASNSANPLDSAWQRHYKSRGNM